MSELFNVEMEQQALGALLTNNHLFDKVPELTADHFYEPTHAAIFTLISRRIAEGRLASPVTLKVDLQDHEGLTALGGVAYLARLAGASISAFALPEYAREIRNLWGKRELQRVLTEAVQMIPSRSSQELCDRIETDISTVQRTSDTKPLSVSFLGASTSAIMQVNEAYQGDTGLAGISTGLKALDDLIGGMAKGRLYVLAGRPAMGKSAIALNMAAKAAIRGEPVLFCSLEMTPEELARRLHSQAMAEKGLRVPYSDMERGRLEEHEFRSLVESAKAMEDLPLDVADTTVKDPVRMRSALRRAMGRYEPQGGVRLLVVDYLQLMRPRGMDRMIDRVGEASQILKEISREFNIPVLALAQLSRQVEARENKRPILSDLRDSGQIEQDADVVMFCYRHAYYLQQAIKSAPTSEARLDAAQMLEGVQNDLDIIVEKQRSGRLGTARLECELPFNVVRDKVEQGDMDF